MKPNTTPGQELPSKHQPSRWEREWKKRRIIAIFVAIVIIAAGSLLGVGLYINKYKPWHQAIVKVNDQTFDMDYYVKLLRLYGVDLESYYATYYASSLVQQIQANEVVKQKAEELGITFPSDEEIEEELKSQLEYDSEEETEEEFYQRIDGLLKEKGISRDDLKQMAILPTILQEKVQEAIGNDDDGANLDEQKTHVKVKAILLGTEEDATDAKGDWSGDFDQLVEDYSPSKYYPDADLVEWIPAGIESSVFDEYIFDDSSQDSGVSDPIRDTNYTTSGGYWLVMVYEPEEEEEQEEEGLYIKAILMDSEEDAKELKTEIENDGDFATLAEDNSLDSSSSNGGDMDWLSLEDIETKFGAGVLAIINALSQDEISAPIEATDGYWLVMVTEGDGEGEEGELYINAMLLATEDEAEEVADEFDGSNFADLAEEYSLDSSKDDDGVIGWMSQEAIDSKFGEGVLAIINALSEDEISTSIYDEDVSKQSGYWLIEVLDGKEDYLSEDHWETLSLEAYDEWLDDEMAKGVEEGWIISYLDDDKMSWALDHL